MYVVSYYEDIGQEYPKELISRWSGSFAEQHFKPVILDEVLAKKHPHYEEIIDVVSTLPTLNGPKFELACWKRWLAYEMFNHPALFADYDVYNFSFDASNLSRVSENLDCLCVFLDEGCRSVFTSSFLQAHEYVRTFPGGRQHLSDELLFRQIFCDFNINQRCFLSREDHALWSPLVHFANGVCPEHQRGNNRYLYIDEFVKLRRSIGSYARP